MAACPAVDGVAYKLRQQVDKPADPSSAAQADDTQQTQATAGSASEALVAPDQEPSYLLQALLCSISALEGADTQLLGWFMHTMQWDFGLRLFWVQLVCMSLAAPFWGILADRGIVKRRTILVIGAWGLGLVTILLAFVTGMAQLIFLQAMRSVLLAALRPISNGIIADVTGEQKRGKVFGRVQSSLLLGMFVATMTVVPMASGQVLGFQGWRVAFVLVGLISMAVSTLVAFLMAEPPHAEPEGSGESGCAAVAHEARSLVQFFRIPTFWVMITQGIFIRWSVMGYMTLFFQQRGIDDKQVAVLSGVGLITGAAGNVIGGLVSDFLARRFLLHGRPLSAQITAACGMVFLVLQVVPPGEGSFGVCLALSIAFGLLGSWAQSGTNLPILSHIVPAEARSRVMTWEWALENSIANAIGPHVVSLLAEKAFGYDIPSADALGKATAATICIPWMACFIAYSALHWSYPRDVKILEKQEQERKEPAAAKAEAAKREGLDVQVVENNV